MQGFLFPFRERENKLGSEIKNTDVLNEYINRFMSSPVRQDMFTGERYYVGQHDILNKKRTAIGDKGEIVEVENLPNNKIVDNRYKKLVDQKVNYLLGKPMTIKCRDRKLSDELNSIFGRNFSRLLRNVGEDSLNCGIGWVYVYYSPEGKLSFKRFLPYEIIPFWADDEHCTLNCAVRVYDTAVSDERGRRKVIRKVRVYLKNGVYRYVYDKGRLERDKKFYSPYFTYGKKQWCWDKVPLVPFRANSREMPLIKNVKSLQDGLDIMLSNFEDNMCEDCRNTILILKNYDGESLGEFRRNLAAYGAVKVRTADGSQGGVDTLNIQVNGDNYKTVIDMLRKTIIENGNGFDGRDERLFSSPNQMNIQSMYSDMDLDANCMETEFRWATGELVDFVLKDMKLKGKGFPEEEPYIIFNRDILINEAEVIDNCIKSENILSRETVAAHHPWVENVYEETERKNREKKISEGGEENDNNSRTKAAESYGGKGQSVQ